MLPDILGYTSEDNLSSKIEDLLFRHKFQIVLLLIGAILVGLGAFLVRKDMGVSSAKVEIIEDEREDEKDGVIAEVAGAVESPGVYKLPQDARIEDLLIAAGGLSVNADRNWMEKSLNRAAKITDRQKIYVPRFDEQSEVLSASKEGVYQTTSSTFGSQGSGLINVNIASQKELETMWGIDPVYAQNIIEHRPYSSVEELLSKKIIKQSVYDRNKDRMTVF